MRECHEEIGQVPDTVVRLASLYPTPGFCDEEMLFFRLSGLTTPTEPAAQDEDEDIEPRTFALRRSARDGPARRDRRHEDGRRAGADLKFADTG